MPTDKSKDPKGKEKMEDEEDEEDEPQREGRESERDFISRMDAEIDKMRDDEGHVPAGVHAWLSSIGKKGRATPPKHHP